MIVAIDIGSGSVRAGLVTAEGVQYVARRPGALALIDGPLLGLDLDDLWARVSGVLDEAAEIARAHDIPVEAITCTSVRYATVWSSSHGDVAWANLARADRDDVVDLQRGMTEADVARLGGWPTALTMSARLRSASRWGVEPAHGSLPLSVASWVLTRLGAAPHVDDVTWADTRMSASSSEEWGLDLVRAGDTVGEYRGAIDTRWHGARLVASVPDTVAAVSALGELLPGDTIAVAGTTTPVVAVATETARGSARDLDDTSWLPFGTMALAESNAGRTGEVVHVLAATLGRDPGTMPTPLGVGAVRSFLGPTLVTPRAFGSRPAPQGIEFVVPFAGVDATDLLGSAWEANAWATDFHMGRVEQRAGTTGRRIVCGGQARSDHFAGLLASASGREIEIVRDEVTLLGAAAAAGALVPVPATDIVGPEIDVEDEPHAWSTRWWERFTAQERVHS